MMHLAVKLEMTMTSITNIYEKMFSVAKTFFHLIFDLVLPQDTTYKVILQYQRTTTRWMQTD